MIEAFSGLGTLIFIGALGYLLARRGILNPAADLALQQTAFYVASPALMLVIIADADLSVMLTPGAGLFLGSAFLTVAAFALFARLALKLSVAKLVAIASTSGWVNANNIGLPVALYVLKDVDYIAAVVILQLVVFAPLAVAALHFTSGGNHFWSVLGRTLRTPLIAATAGGVAISLMNWEIPEPIYVPIDVLGAAAIPIMLLTLGSGMNHMRLFKLPKGTASTVLCAVGAKTLLMPLIAWIGAKYVLGLDHQSVFALTAIAALPTAQNTYNFAVTFQVAEEEVRDVLVYSTLAFLPILLALITIFA